MYLGDGGLDNHGFRYYDPSTGRYLTRDPIGYADGMNVYLSVHNNPINHIDPVGLKSDFVEGVEAVLSWLYTGSISSSQSVYDSSVAAAADYYIENAGDTHRALSRIAAVDKTGLAQGTQKTLEYLEGPTLHQTVMQSGTIGRGAGGTNAGPLMPGIPGHQLPPGTPAIPGVISPPHIPPQNLGQAVTQGIHDYGPTAIKGTEMIQDAMGEMHKNQQGSSGLPIDSSRPQHGTPSHDATGYNQARDWEGNPNYSDVRYNQDLVDTQRNRIPGFRPDVQGTRTLSDGTQVRDVLEIQSPSQNDPFMDQKRDAMRDALGDQAGDVRWIPPEKGAARR